MAMRGFAYQRAVSVKEASALIAREPGRAAALAGGTDLLGTLKDNIHAAYPEILVDLKAVPGLRRIKATKGGLAIGALATLAELASHPATRARYPLLAQAAKAVASPQIRNMGTVAGNICQEPRCWYYRTPGNLFHCLRKGGGRCGAMFGENRYHSVFGAARMAASPCQSACPNRTDVPAVMSALRRGDPAAAARTLLEVNPLPAVTGRICPHYCESDCGRTGYDEAVSIREVERFLGDYSLEHAQELYQAPRSDTRQRVAVAGSGPAGLAAAYFLRKAGHRVTVFERNPVAGGMLAYCIPSYRLPREVLDKVVAALKGMGVEFQLGAEAGGAGLSFAALRKRHDALFLGTGLWRQKSLGLEDEGLLVGGLQFLLDCRAGKASCAGRRVLVIGGGSVAVDVAVSALRLGAAGVAMACLESRADMPAFPEDIEQALLEKVELLPSWGPSKVIASGGRLKGMELVRCTEVFDREKRFRPVFDHSVTRTFAADDVILAIGLRADLSYAGRSLKLGRGLIAAHEETMATNLKGVFAGGDAVSGPASVVSAIAAGRKAAQAIDSFLAGRKAKASRQDRRAPGAMLDFNAAALARSGRAQVPQTPPERRRIDREDRPTLGRAAAEAEARRCANCGCVAVNASDLAPALLALGARIRTTKRTLPAAEFFASRPMQSTALAAGELVTEVFIPAPAPGARQGFLKFRLRNAIDFPIVSVASVLDLEGGKLGSASIALGAVAPVPLRAQEAEAFLKGRAPDEDTAARAGDIAVQACHPLAKNGFKVQLVRALLRKAILAAGC
ncbi:MAG: FAD binding domain-containing protein [Elusimicrobia bacterium]|nr:FAD binding domain-containing protein [Elusimicrobiota bacterium]